MRLGRDGSRASLSLHGGVDPAGSALFGAASLPICGKRGSRHVFRRALSRIPDVGILAPANDERLQPMSDSDRRRTPSGDGRREDGRTDGGNNDGPNTGVVVKARPRTRKPAMYKVLMLNDDYTPMEFVVHVLERFFQKTREEATRIMLHVHRRGVGVCGVFTYEVAETKVTQVMDLARQNQHPLQCTIEKE
jgi:ATP-dependent Clp protease adaptor protein ClpS